MRRIIKFRAWDKKTKTMLRMPLENHFGISRFFRFLNDDCELMQFTGLLDKNGKEIYEGDILKIEGHSWKTSNPYQFEAAVVWYEDGWATKTDKITHKRIGYIIDAGKYAFTIIGTIHENPELLEARKR